jgi:hypothetical protein
MIMLMVIFCFIIGFRSYETCSEPIPLPTKFAKYLPDGNLLKGLSYEN